MSHSGKWGMIAAVSPEWVIGVGGEIPWHYPEDLKRLKRVTMGATLIMGRHTWESIGQKPLPGRRNIVITRRDYDNVETFSSLQQALESCEGDVWFVGGAGIYEEAMPLCDLIDLTFVPDHVDHPEAVKFPPIDAERFEAGPRVSLESDPRLEHQVYYARESV